MANPTVASLATGGAQFFDTLNAQQQQAFGGSQAALQAISSAWAPVLQTGAVPYGYSVGLDSLLTSKAITEGSAATTAAQNAAELQMKQASGGAPVLPTGAQEQIKADIAARGAQSTAQTITGIKEAGYEQGVKNLEGATSAELGIASGENAPGLAGAATGAGELGLKAGEAQWQENQVTSPLNITSSILGDIESGVKGVTGIGDVASMFKHFGTSGTGDGSSD